MLQLELEFIEAPRQQHGAVKAFEGVIVQPGFQFRIELAIRVKNGKVFDPILRFYDLSRHGDPFTRNAQTSASDRCDMHRSDKADGVLGV